jgi:hypothetical protein
MWPLAETSSSAELLMDPAGGSSASTAAASAAGSSPALPQEVWGPKPLGLLLQSQIVDDPLFLRLSAGAPPAADKFQLCSDRFWIRKRVTFRMKYAELGPDVDCYMWFLVDSGSKLTYVNSVALSGLLGDEAVKKALEHPLGQIKLVIHHAEPAARATISLGQTSLLDKQPGVDGIKKYINIIGADAMLQGECLIEHGLAQNHYRFTPLPAQLPSGEQFIV